MGSHLREHLQLGGTASVKVANYVGAPNHRSAVIALAALY